MVVRDYFFVSAFCDFEMVIHIDKRDKYRVEGVSPMPFIIQYSNSKRCDRY